MRGGTLGCEGEDLHFGSSPGIPDRFHALLESGEGPRDGVGKGPDEGGTYKLDSADHNVN